MGITVVPYLPGCSRYATGVPGSLNHLLGIYGVLSFGIGLLGTWSASNNAAMFAEVRHQGKLTCGHPAQACCTYHHCIWFQRSA